MLSPCQYESMRREIEILKNEKNKTESAYSSNSGITSNQINAEASSAPVNSSIHTEVGKPSLPQVEPELTRSSVTEAGTHLESSKPSIEQVVSILPTNIRNKAKLLLAHIDQSACLTWDNLLHIIIEGKVLHRSNIADLLKYILQTGRAPSFTPNNLIEFLCCLKKANVPQTLLNATARKKMITIKNDDACSFSSSASKGGGDSLGGGGGLSDLNVDTFSLPPPGLKSLKDKGKRKKSFVWLDY